MKKKFTPSTQIKRKHSVKYVFSGALSVLIFVFKKAMWNLKKFEEVYSRYLSSGLRVKDFCQNECLHVSRFFYWQRKLKEHQREQGESSGFVPLLFHQSGNPLKSSIDFQSLPHTSKAEGVCELVYPNGVKLRIPLSADIRKMEQLILLFR